MTTNDQESNETPVERVEALSDEQCRRVLVRLVQAITANRSTRHVPDILHEACLLSQFEVYDAEKEIDDMEWLIKTMAAEALN